MASIYRAPEAEQELKIINISDLQKKAEKLLSPGAWGYLNGGAGDEITLCRNTEAFNQRSIFPRILSGVEAPKLETTILGIRIQLPVIMASVAVHGLAHVGAEKETAAGVASAGTIMAVSTYSNDTIAEIAAAGKGAPQWFQLYMSKDDSFNRHICDVAEKNGAKAIIITADATVGGNREADARTGFVMPLPMKNLTDLGSGAGHTIKEVFANSLQKITPDDIGKIATYTKLPVIVKGVQCAEDAVLSIGAGASAIWVSNHGGRQLDGGPASFEVLPSIAAAVNRKVPIIFDSGIRRAQHVFKALALGADVVAIGRPALYGLMLGGSLGVKSVFDYFASELSMVMQLAGTQNIEAVKNTKLL